MRCKVHVRFGGGKQFLSYYGWRGADIRNILDFEKDWPEAQVVRLEENYRSVPDILECANNVISNNVNRKSKNLWTANEEERQTVIAKQFNTASEEARFAAQQILDLRENDHFDYEDFVILFRTNIQFRNFEEQFKRLGIPYKSVGSLAFYDRAEIKDLLSYLSLIENKKDDLSFNRIVNMPRRGIGAKSIEKLQEYADFKGWSLYESVLNVEDIPTLTKGVKIKFIKFRELIESIRVESIDESLDKKLEIIFDRTGYKDYLKTDTSINGESKQEFVKELIGTARENKDMTVNEFLENAALSSSVDEMDDSNKVSLMTVHSAKGLEFPVVFLTGLEENLFPSYQSVSKGDVEEERRLCYVGITRAKERLFLTHARERLINGDMRYQKPSRFLSELPENIVNTKYLKHDYYTSFKPERETKKELYQPNIRKKTNTSKIKTGDIVKHQSFGRGFVVNNKKGILTILFPGGDKKLIAEGYVEKINEK